MLMKLQFDLVPERRATDAVLILRRMQHEYYAEENFFVDIEKAFD